MLAQLISSESAASWCVGLCVQAQDLHVDGCCIGVGGVLGVAWGECEGSAPLARRYVYGAVLQHCGQPQPHAPGCPDAPQQWSVPEFYLSELIMMPG